MREHRGQIGEALLGLAGACWIAAVTVWVADSARYWAVGLGVAGLLCLIASVVFFRLGPAPTAKPSPIRVGDYAEVVLKDAGVWPSRWQRLRHPRTPVDDLIVRIPESVVLANAGHWDGLRKIRDELGQSAYILGLEVREDRHLGERLDSSAWRANESILKRPEFEDVHAMVSAAHEQGEIRNANSTKRWGRRPEVTDDPLPLTPEERAQREAAYKIFSDAIEALHRVLPETQR